MTQLDLLVEMRSEMDALVRERNEVVASCERHRSLLVDVELLLRHVMEYPETWEIAGTVAQLLVRLREEIGLDQPAGAAG